MSFFIALRYLFSKKKRNAINIISSIAVLAFAVCTASLVIILSAMNGFEEVIFSLYNKYNPDVKITLVEGKFFNKSDVLKHLSDTGSIKNINFVLEDNAAIRNHDYQSVCRVKGVQNNYFAENNLDNEIINGMPVLFEDSIEFAILGANLASKLGVDVNSPFNKLSLITPRKGEFSLTDVDAIIEKRIEPGAEILLDEEVNNKTVFVPLSFAESLFESVGKLSSMEINYNQKTNIDEAILSLKNKVGIGFNVLNRYEQQSSLYKMFKSEKWASYFILTFILLIAAFNALGSLTMLVIEKQNDIKTLSAIGMSSFNIKKIFFFNGLLISGIGAFIGVFIGVLLIVLQKEYGLLKMQGAIIENYPVKLKWSDIVLILSTVFVLGTIIGIYPASRSSKANSLGK